MNTLQKLATIGMIITSGLGISASAVQAQTKKNLHEVTTTPQGNQINDTTEYIKRYYDISKYPPNDTAHYGKNKADLERYKGIEGDGKTDIPESIPLGTQAGAPDSVGTKQTQGSEPKPAQSEEGGQ